MKLTILGCFSASPSKNHFPSAQILEIGGTNVLIDCGEGTQIQLRRCGIKFYTNKPFKSIKQEWTK